MNRKEDNTRWHENESFSQDRYVFPYKTYQNSKDASSLGETEYNDRSASTPYQLDWTNLDKVKFPIDATTSYHSLADRIFGRQIHQQALTIDKIRASAAYRQALHEAHMQELDERHNILFNQLYLVRRPYNTDAPQKKIQLEKLQHLVEKDRHDEELGFWKDMAELYGSALESVFEYQTARSRYGLLGGLDRSDG